jgi:hypothetical protein
MSRTIVVLYVRYKYVKYVPHHTMYLCFNTEPFLYIRLRIKAFISDLSVDDDDDDVYLEYYSGKRFHINYSVYMSYVKHINPANKA